MRSVLVIVAVVLLGGAARAQSQGDILRRMADCHDNYKNDYSGYLRCMADVEDEIDRSYQETQDTDLSTNYVPSPQDVGAYNDLITCIASAKTSPEIAVCRASYKLATHPATTSPTVAAGAPVPDIPDAGTAHGDFLKCMYYAQTPAQIDKCSADYKAAQSAPPRPLPAGLPIGPNSYPECSQRDPSVTEQECNSRLTPDAPILSACRRFATQPEGATQPEAYRLCAVKAAKR